MLARWKIYHWPLRIDLFLSWLFTREQFPDFAAICELTLIRRGTSRWRWENWWSLKRGEPWLCCVGLMDYPGRPAMICSSLWTLRMAINCERFLELSEKWIIDIWNGLIVTLDRWWRQTQNLVYNYWHIQIWLGHNWTTNDGKLFIFETSNLKKLRILLWQSSVCFFKVFHRVFTLCGRRKLSIFENYENLNISKNISRSTVILKIGIISFFWLFKSCCTIFFYNFEH